MTKCRHYALHVYILTWSQKILRRKPPSILPNVPLRAGGMNVISAFLCQLSKAIECPNRGLSCLCVNLPIQVFCMLTDDGVFISWIKLASCRLPHFDHAENSESSTEECLKAGINDSIPYLRYRIIRTFFLSGVAADVFLPSDKPK